MEKMPGDNKERGDSIAIVLDTNKNKIGVRMWGRPIGSGVTELIKIFAIMNSVAKIESPTTRTMEEKVLDLWNEFDVQLFQPEDIFTEKVLTELRSAKTVNSLSLELNDGPIVIRSGSTTESVMKEWKDFKDDAYNSPGAVAERKEAELEEQEENGEKQKEIDAMFAQVNSVDFKDTDKSLEWLVDYSECVVGANIGVDTHLDEIVKIFEENGYSREKNNVADFMVAETLKNNKMMKENIIGYILVNMEMFRESDLRGIRKKLDELAK